jgi:hypothetical protein
MSILTRLFKQSNEQNADYWAHGWENSKTMHEVVITTIESIVILAALDIAIGKQFNWVLVVIDGAAFLSLMTYC